METIRTILIDEQPLFCEGICETLKQMEGCRYIGAVTDAGDISEIVRMYSPYVVLISGELAFSDPLEIVQQIHYIAPSIAIILLTSLENEDFLFQLVKAGITAYYTRHITPSALRDAVKQASRGEYLVPQEFLSRPTIEQSIIQLYQGETGNIKEKPRPLSSELTVRELEILNCMAEGNTNTSIGTILHISAQTVKNHITSLLKKLDVPDRTSAVVKAYSKGWITLKDKQ